MRVRVRFFAGTRDAVGASALDVDAPDRATVAEVLASLTHVHPRLAPYSQHLLLAVDGEFAAPTRVLANGSELAVMPPVSGGMLSPEPLDEGQLRAGLDTSGAGAVVVFWGLARAEGGAVDELRFEAYAPLAERELARVREEAIAKFSLVDCAIHHRTGAVPAGAPAVGVAVSARHRRAAFEAAAWVMDELKARVPIWKQEVGPARTKWVNDPTTTG